ncbi:MAG: acyltransferase [Acetobacteraceae bacterium]|nr:acyltransferase [Acetobacteraceae bacterium]
MSQLAERFELGQAELNRLLPMEGLRGIAVLLVFFVHYGTLVDPYLSGLALPIGVSLRIVGNAGVDLFFVLSGYLIYGTLIRRPQPFLRFMGRRVQRLYPAFLVVFAIYVLLSFVLPSDSKLPNGLWSGLVYAGANVLMLPGIFPVQPMIAVAWSLSYEMFFYLTVPLLIGLLWLRSWDRWARVTVFLLAIIAAQAFQLPYPRMGMFGCGMILAEVLPVLKNRFAGGSAPKLAGLALLFLNLLGLAAIPACGFVLLQKLPVSMRFTTIFFACFLLCAAGFVHHGPVAKILITRPLRWVGNMSYSYYLVHGLVLKIVFFFVASLQVGHWLGSLAFWVLLPPAFLCTLIGSAVLFLLVERPFSILPPGRLQKLPAMDRVAPLGSPLNSGISLS